MKIMRLRKEFVLVRNKVIFPPNTKFQVENELDNLVQIKTMDNLFHFEVEPSFLFIPKGQLVTIYRHSIGVDTSLGGISSGKYTHAILCGKGLGTTFEETNNTPALQMWTREIPKTNGTVQYTVAIPYDNPKGSWSFGGNYVGGTDSRIANVLEPYSICPLHDRDTGLEKR